MNKPHKARVVISLTTLPDRYDDVLRVLDSLATEMHVIDAIYLATPAKSKRLNLNYDILPSSILSRCIHVPMEIDYGPASKLYGGLSQEKDDDTMIITMDDDNIYPPGFVTALIRHAEEYPDSAICSTGALIGWGLPCLSIVSNLERAYSWNCLTGFPIPAEGRKIDLVFGVTGVLYRRKFFSSNIHDFFNYTQKEGNDGEAVFCNDDILISGYLASKDIPRRVFGDIPRVKQSDTWTYDALSKNIPKMIMRMYRAYTVVKRWGLFSKYEAVGFDETVVGRCVIFLFFLIIIVLAIVLFIIYWNA